jgi:hypothetical protein
MVCEDGPDKAAVTGRLGDGVLGPFDEATDV